MRRDRIANELGRRLRAPRGWARILREEPGENKGLLSPSANVNGHGPHSAA